MTAQKSCYESATAIIIENRNNGLRNRKLDFIRYTYALCTVYIRRLQRQELGHFEVIGVVFRTVVVAFG